MNLFSVLSLILGMLLVAAGFAADIFFLRRRLAALFVVLAIALFAAFAFSAVLPASAAPECMVLTGQYGAQTYWDDPKTQGVSLTRFQVKLPARAYYQVKALTTDAGIWYAQVPIEGYPDMEIYVLASAVHVFSGCGL